MTTNGARAYVSTREEQEVPSVAVFVAMLQRHAKTSCREI